MSDMTNEFGSIAKDGKVLENCAGTGAITLEQAARHYHISSPATDVLKYPTPNLDHSPSHAHEHDERSSIFTPTKGELSLPWMLCP